VKISDFRMDSELETGGVWCDVGEGLRVLVARARNVKFREYVRQLMKPHLRKVRRGKIDPDLLEDINRKATAKTILLGWEDLQDDDGKDVPYSPEKAEEYLKEFPDFAEIVMEFATDVDLYRERDREDAEGN
jgi:hypothetical protein